MSLELRHYQAAAINSVLTKWNESDRLLGVAPTGSGQTIKFAHIARDRSAGRVLILAHRDELIEKARDKLLRACELVAAKEKAINYADLEANVVVASVQTLSRNSRLQRFSADHFYHGHRDPWHLTKPEASRWIAEHKG